MRIPTLVTACAVAALFVSQAAVAQTDADATASQPAAAQTKKEVRKQNHQLENAVRHALTRTKGLTTTGITVLAKGGVVSLIGNVPDESQIALAGNATKQVAHVSTVDNRLGVAEEGGGS